MVAWVAGGWDSADVQHSYNTPDNIDTEFREVL